MKLLTDIRLIVKKWNGSILDDPSCAKHNHINPSRQGQAFIFE